MTRSGRSFCVVLMAILLVAMSQQAMRADSGTDRFATDASNSIGPFLVVGELSLLSNGKAAKPEMIQGVKAVVATGIFTELLKVTVREKRPHSESLTSFPSGHTSAAFAMATVVGDYEPRYRLLAYGVASTIGWSRVEVGAHRWQDVVAGAALGYFAAKHFTRQHLDLGPGGAGWTWTW